MSLLVSSLDVSRGNENPQNVIVSRYLAVHGTLQVRRSIVSKFNGWRYHGLKREAEHSRCR